MGAESLRALLAQVHQRLNASGSVDEEARELLGTVMRDIERSLGSGAPAAGASRANLPRLESLAVRFEALHPALAQALREAIDALGKAGI